MTVISAAGLHELWFGYEE